MAATNVERILARGERLGELMDKSEDLQAGELEEKEHGPQQKNKIKELSDQVEEVKDTMKKNLDQILDREERLDVLLEMSQYLKDRAQNFNRTAMKVSRSYWWKNVKLIVVIVVVMLIIVLIILLLSVRL